MKLYTHELNSSTPERHGSLAQVSDHDPDPVQLPFSLGVMAVAALPEHSCLSNDHG
jgi:hypothetical protein